MIARTAVGIFLAIASFGAWALPPYDIVELVTDQPLSTASDVSPNGTIVGWYGSSPATAYIWKNGTLRVLGTGTADAVNDSGLVGGRDASNNVQFWRPDGSLVNLGRYGQVMQINASGMAVGWYYDTPLQSTGNVGHAFLWQDGTFTQLPDDCSLGINNANQVLCGNRIYDLQSGQFTPIPPPEGYTFSAKAINDKGEVLGASRGLALYSGGATRIVYLSSDSAPSALNNNDLLIGDGEGVYGFAVEPDGTKTNFSSLPAVQAGGWSKLRASRVNDNGWIVGTATYGPHGSPEAFLLRPHVSSSSGPPPLALTASKRADFNGDLRGDLLWRSSSGSYGVWLMDGHDISQAASIAAPAGATFVLRADFNGDGRTDLLWKDPAGAYYVSLVNGTALDTTQVINAGTGWVVAGAGDFNGDGKTDLLWWHPTQGYGAWLMNGGAVTQYGLITPAPDSRPAIIADFNGDGRDDIVWLADDGHLELYTMNGLAASPAGQIRAAGTGFVPVAVGDFNGDAKADIVWGNPDGRQSLWLMDGATAINSTSLVDAGSPWSVVSAPDLDGDGRADLLWKSTDGSYGAWLMSGTTTLGYQLLLGGGSGWSIVQAQDVSSDSKADLLWRRNDGAYGLWLMNGLNATWQGAVLGPGTGWELVQ